MPQVKTVAYTLPSSLMQNANSVVQEDAIVIDVTNPKSLNFKQKRTVTVLNKKGHKDIDAYVRYDNNTKVKSLKATVYDAFGNEIEDFKKRDFKDVSAVSQISLYEDSRILYLDYTPQQYPYTITVEKETESKSSAFIPVWQPVSGYYSSTASARYEIRYDAENSLSYVSFNWDGQNISVEKTSGKLIFEATNIGAIQNEYMAPSYLDVIPHTRFALDQFYLEGVSGSAKNWNDFGIWMNRALLSESNDLPEETAKEIKSLVKNLPNKEAKARAIYQYVQDKVRYISVQIEIGGWKPMLASDVDELSYGDCKALTNYTKSLMDAAGIPAYYTILYAGSEKRDLNDELLAIQGNHAILGLELDEDDAFTWLECTSQDRPFGYMGTFTDDRNVFMVKPDGGEFKTTTAYGLKDNIKRIAAELKIMVNGDLKGPVSITSKGVFYGSRNGFERVKDQDQTDYFKNQWSHIRGVSLDNLSTTNNKESIAFEEALSLNTKNYLPKAGEDFILKPNVFANYKEDLPIRYPNRTHPFVIERSTAEIDTITFQLPDGYTITNLPEDISINEDFGSYNTTYAFKQGKLVYKREFILKEGTYNADRYSNFRDFYKRIITQDQKKLLIQDQKT